MPGLPRRVRKLFAAGRYFLVRFVHTTGSTALQSIGIPSADVS
jgi:hypothetical protein